ncbi:hypothetical protein HY285_00650 [Candidatus Peregrinibacteria bacterium]|nr:hypothetical protein [Candidatus Peregrinibacteria bacterium]MBI3816040.1 hypothetical protein [Candidatus Peregrinibacteria bacterium]
MQSQTALLWTRGIRRGVVSLRRDPAWGTMLAVLAGILFLTQLFLLLAVSGQGVEQLLRSRTELRLGLRPGANDQQIHAFFSAVHALPSVERARYVTSEQAYENERKRDPDLVAFLEQMKIPNPFPDTIAVTLRSLSDYASFSAFIRQAQWSGVVDPTFLTTMTDQESQILSLIAVTRSVEALVGIFLGVTVVIVVFVLIALVRERSLRRREEIILERLSGAQDLSLMLPFVIESTLLLVLGLLLGTALLIIFVLLLPLLVPALAPGGPFSPLRDTITSLLSQLAPFGIPLELLILPILAFIGVRIALHRHLLPRIVMHGH